jgi:hypothetical protein
MLRLLLVLKVFLLEVAQLLAVLQLITQEMFMFLIL